MKINNKNKLTGKDISDLANLARWILSSHYSSKFDNEIKRMISELSCNDAKQTAKDIINKNTDNYLVKELFVWVNSLKPKYKIR